jgi:GT2 family glycosyltransferase
MTPDQILCIPTIDTDIFFDTQQPRDIDFLVYFGKHPPVRGYPKKSIILRDRPKRQEDLGHLLRRCKKLINYDNFTILTFEATLCGCPVVLIPDQSKQKESLENNEFGLFGVAWGESKEEFKKAQATLNRAKQVSKDLEEKAQQQLRHFIQVTQARAAERTTLALQKTQGLISIVILNYNGQDLLQQYLPSILQNRQIHNPVEVIVVDNHSNDQSVEIIKKQFPEIKLIVNPQNLGFARGINAGAQAARGDLILFLNNDVEVTPGYLKPLLEHFRDPDIFGVSPKVIRPTQGNLVESLILGDFRGGIVNARFAETQNLTHLGSPQEVFSVCGAAFMVDRNKFMEIGGMDPVFTPFYYEETDLSYRALLHRWKIIYEPSSTVYHMHNQSIGKNYSRNYAAWSYRKNQYLCVWKNIRDPLYLLKHAWLMVAPKLLIPNFVEWKAFFSAVSQLPKIIKYRRRHRDFRFLADRKIFNLFFRAPSNIRNRKPGN